VEDIKAFFEQFVTKDGIKPFVEDLAGVEMALAIFAAIHPDRPALRAGLAKALESLKPEYRASRSGRLLWRLITIIDDQTSPPTGFQKN
jgi:hypothetical protein